MSTIIQALKAYTRSPIGATDVTIPLKYLKDSRGNYITSMPAGATIIYATLEPQSPTNQESISFSGIQNDGNNRITLTGVVRNLNPQPPFTALPANVPHGNNIEVILSNTPAFYNTFMQANAVNTISAKWTFTVSPDVPTPTDPANAVPKSYVDAIDAKVVHKTGNESIAGTKTFQNSPQVPNPATGNDAVNYATLLATAMGTAGIAVGLTDFYLTYDRYDRVARLIDKVLNKVYFFGYRTKDDIIPYVIDDGTNFVLINYNSRNLLLNGKKI